MWLVEVGGMTDCRATSRLAVAWSKLAAGFTCTTHWPTGHVYSFNIRRNYHSWHQISLPLHFVLGTPMGRKDVDGRHYALDSSIYRLCCHSRRYQCRRNPSLWLPIPSWCTSHGPQRSKPWRQLSLATAGGDQWGVPSSLQWSDIFRRCGSTRRSWVSTQWKCV